MTPRGARAWKVFCLTGIALWIGVTVLAAVLNDDPSDPRPVTLTFAAGGAIFFGLIFGISLWNTRTKKFPDLELLYAELSIEPELGGNRAAQLGTMRFVARCYLVLGMLVTALGLAAIVQESVGVGSARTTLTVMVVIVVLWALAIPLVLRVARRATDSVLSPLHLEQAGAAIVGERYGRRMRIDVTAAGWRTRLSPVSGAPELRGDGILAHAGRGDSETWRDVTVSADGDDGVLVSREGHGHEGPSWLWDVWLAERIAGGSGAPAGFE